MAFYDDLYDEMLGVAPASDGLLDLSGPTPESALVDPMLGVTPAFGNTMTAPDQYGYNPQPRPMLPAPIADPAAELYGPFRGVWEAMQQPVEEDPLAALRTPPPAEEPPFLLPAQPMAALGQDYGMGMVEGPGERALRERGFGRVVDRLNWLRGLRAQRGY